MDNSQITADIARKIQDMQDEISSLKAQLADRAAEAEDKAPDLRTLFEEGFAKLHEAVRPIAERAHARIGEPARDAVARVEEKISIHPFAAIMMALGAGLVVGRLLDAGPHYHDRNPRT